VPGALTIMKRRVGELASDVRVMRFMCRLDSGKISPDPPHDNEVWNYEGYIRWIESHRRKWSESLPVVHRDTIQFVLFPSDLYFTGEEQYHLDLAARYRVKACSDVLRLYHLDADNNSWHPDTARMVRNAPTLAARLESIILTHGQGIKAWAPHSYQTLVAGLVTQQLLSRQRARALRLFGRAIRDRALTARLWVIVVLGLISSRLLAYAKLAHGRITSLHR
jgi:hypothetical protein